MYYYYLNPWRKRILWPSIMDKIGSKMCAGQVWSSVIVLSRSHSLCDNTVKDNSVVWFASNSIYYYKAHDHHHWVVTHQTKEFFNPILMFWMLNVVKVNDARIKGWWSKSWCCLQQLVSLIFSLIPEKKWFFLCATFSPLFLHSFSQGKN